jgi:tryptophanyl-tRNA synthetase
MLPGFKEGQEKMSKSDPSSTIFMEDDEVYISHEVFFFFLANIPLMFLVLVTPYDAE